MSVMCNWIYFILGKHVFCVLHVLKHFSFFIQCLTVIAYRVNISICSVYFTAYFVITLETFNIVIKLYCSSKYIHLVPNLNQSIKESTHFVEYECVC